MIEVDRSTAPLIAEPEDAFYVPEHDFLVAHTGQTPVISTYGLYICTAIAIHNRNKGRGLLAHLSYTDDLVDSIDTILRGYSDTLADSDVHVMKASEDIRERWPTAENVADMFVKKGPRSVTLDDNLARGREVRAASLNLHTGQFSEIANPSTWRTECPENTMALQSINQYWLRYKSVLDTVIVV